jgi:hypothetical protein
MADIVRLSVLGDHTSNLGAVTPFSIQRPQHLLAMTMEHLALFNSPRQSKRVLLSRRTGIKFGPTLKVPWLAFLSFYAFFHPLNLMQLTYLGKCPGTTCTGVNAATLKWVGISQPRRRLDIHEVI